ncbi:MAG: DUF262 domain-containing protein [Deltaproteobacteria bacterium]|nr:DUF262 domain-containing protein [Deltaproteobacteria bacterium]
MSNDVVASDEQRLQQKIEKALPMREHRAAALEFLARTIERADEERADGWYLQESANGLSLMTARLEAFRIRPGRIHFSVMGPVEDSLRTELGSETREDEAWRAIPGGIALNVPAASAHLAREKLEVAQRRFIEAAMSRMRKAITLEAHCAAALEWLSREVGRELPKPAVAPLELSGEPDEEPADGRESPRIAIRGRPQIFNVSNMQLSHLLGMIEHKTLALPDLQRPFVWEDKNVRDLLDSLFVGFPVGTLVFWQVSDGKEARVVGDTERLKVTMLIIDGQQRLTSLYAVMRGAEVVDQDGQRRKITIAFRPRDGRFEVADAAVRNDPEFIADVREIWSGTRSKSRLARDIFDALRAKERAVNDEYERAVEENLDRAQGIANYAFPVVTVQKSAGVDDSNEEDIAEIFVRLNNQGKRLGQTDFVLTLLSVFHGGLRDRIEQRAREMSTESVVEIDAQQLLRVTCAVGFHRAKMSAIYRFLRGVDPASGDVSVEARKARLATLDLAADECIDKTIWRDFTLRVVHAGFVSDALIASNNAILNSFAIYVLGRRIGVERHKLDELISRWVFASMLSARYSASSETRFDEDLSRIAGLKVGEGEAFAAALDRALSEVLSGDYWTNRLVRDLETQRGRAPAALGFRAAQVVLGARALFGDQSLRDMLNPHGHGARAAVESHHLFPTAWLQSKGLRDRRQLNQVANFADVGWYENAMISGQSPQRYVPLVRKKRELDDDRWGRMCAEHALPPGWEELDYETFLTERRRRMADLTRVAYRKLGGESDAPPLDPPWFVAGSESVWRRIVDTERSLRALVRTVYGELYGASNPSLAAQRIREALGGPERDSFDRALRSRPASADPLSVVDYLYLGQLPKLLFLPEPWQKARVSLASAAPDVKAKLQSAIDAIAPVRNEIAHVREVSAERLQRASLACSDVLSLLRAR